MQERMARMPCSAYLKLRELRTIRAAVTDSY
jgi:hypothetical protein